MPHTLPAGRDPAAQPARRDDRLMLDDDRGDGQGG
jgi:hypothetical protein